MGVAVGVRADPMAHRVLGAGAPRARRDDRRPRRRARPRAFPHHECETAQSEAATGAPFVRHWLHVGLVGLDGTKMSKSLGNLVFVGDLLKEWEPAVVRLALLSHHYRPDWQSVRPGPRRGGVASGGVALGGRCGHGAG